MDANEEKETKPDFKLEIEDEKVKMWKVSEIPTSALVGAVLEDHRMAYENSIKFQTSQNTKHLKERKFMQMEGVQPSTSSKIWKHYEEKETKPKPKSEVNDEKLKMEMYSKYTADPKSSLPEDQRMMHENFFRYLFYQEKKYLKEEHNLTHLKGVQPSTCSESSGYMSWDQSEEKETKPGGKSEIKDEKVKVWKDSKFSTTALAEAVFEDQKMALEDFMRRQAYQEEKYLEEAKFMHKKDVQPSTSTELSSPVRIHNEKREFKPNLTSEYELAKTVLVGALLKSQMVLENAARYQTSHKKHLEDDKLMHMKVVQSSSGRFPASTIVSEDQKMAHANAFRYQTYQERKLHEEGIVMPRVTPSTSSSVCYAEGFYNYPDNYKESCLSQKRRASMDDERFPKSMMISLSKSREYATRQLQHVENELSVITIDSDDDDTPMPKAAQFHHKPVNESLELQSKLLAKCRLETSNEVEWMRSVIESFCEHYLMRQFIEVVTSYDPIIFNFKINPESFCCSNLPEFGEDFIYVSINIQKNRKAFFSYEIVKNALKIIFKDQKILLKEDQNALATFNFLKELRVDPQVKLLMQDDKTFEFFELLAGQFFCLYNEDRVEAFDFYSSSFEFLHPYLHSNFNAIRALNRKFCLLKSLEDSDIKLSPTVDVDLSFYLGKVVMIETNIPQGVLHAIYNRLSSVMEFSILYVDLNLFCLEDVQTDFLNVESFVMKFIINASNCDEESLKLLRNLNQDASITIVGRKKDCELIEKLKIFDESNVTKICKNFKWNDLDEDTKKFFLDKQILFQNRQVEFGKIFKSDHENIPPSVLQTLCSDELLEINSSESFVGAPFNFLIEEHAFNNSEPESSSSSKQKFCYFNFASLESLLEKAKDVRIVVITGGKKSGKSNAMRSIGKKLEKENNVVKFIHSTIESGENFKDYVTKHIQTEGEKFIFSNFYEQGDTKILIDDAKNASWINNILQDFSSHRSSNQVWISTTDEIARRIDRKFITLRVKMTTVTEEEKDKFINEHQDAYDDSIMTMCDTLLDKWSMSFEERKVCQMHAFKIYFMNQKSFCGLNLENVPVPHNSKVIAKDVDGNPKFLNLIWIDYFITSFVTDSFMYFEGDCGEFMNFFLRILREDVFKNIRTMLNGLESLTTFDEEIYGEALLEELEGMRIFKGRESFFAVNNLVKFIIRLLNRSLDPEDFEYQKIVENLLIDIIPNKITKHSIELEPLKRLIQSSKNIFGSGSLIQCLIERCSDVEIFDWILNNYGLQVYYFHHYSFCITAITNENYTVLEFLLNQSFISQNRWENILEVSLYSENQYIYNIVKNLGEIAFGRSSSGAILRCETILDNITKLHEFIKTNNREEVRRFIQDNPGFKYCQGRENEDAIELSIRLKKYEIFRILVENSFETRNKMNMEEFLTHFLLSNIGKCEKLDSSYIGLLHSKFMNHNSSEVDQLNVVKTIKEISKYPYFEDILKTVASSEETKIISTLSENVKHFDASHTENTKALYYYQLKIILLPSKKSKSEFYQHFAHEFTHCALDLVYENDCKPYPKDDDERMKEWQEITNHYRTNKKYHSESIIENVFSLYEEKMQEVELAVRAMHLVARDCTIGEEKEFQRCINGERDSGFDENFRDYPLVLQHLKLKFPEIFFYHENYIAKDMKIIDGVPLRKLNESFGIWSALIQIEVSFKANNFLSQILDDESNVKLQTKSPKLLLKNIYDIFLQLCDGNALLSKSENIFVDLRILSRDASLASKFSHLSHSKTMKRVIIYCYGERISNHLVWDLTKLKQQLILINPVCNFGNIHAEEHNFSFGWFSSDQPFYIGLNEESRRKIEKKKVEFHSQEILFKEILNDHDVDETMLNILCLSNNFKLNQQEEFKTFDKRKILSCNSRSNLVASTLTVKMNLNSLIDANEKFILIHDAIGNGKTDTLRNLYKELIENDKSAEFWISFVPLKQHEDLFKTQLDRIPYELVNFLSPLDRRIFELYWNKNKVIFLFDEIDGLRHKERSNVLKFFKLKNFHKVFLTCRANLRHKIVNELNHPKEVTLCPFDEKEKISIIRKYKKDMKLLNFSRTFHSISFLFLLTRYGEEILQTSFKFSHFNVYKIYFSKILEDVHKSFQISANDFNLAHNNALKNFNKAFDEIFSILQAHFDCNSTDVEKFPLIDPSTFSFINSMDGSYWMANALCNHYQKPTGIPYFDRLFRHVLLSIVRSQDDHQNDLKMLDGAFAENNELFAQSCDQLAEVQREFNSIRFFSEIAKLKNSYPNVAKALEILSPL